jgi:hypothetical protein
VVASLVRVNIQPAQPVNGNDKQPVPIPPPSGVTVTARVDKGKLLLNVAGLPPGGSAEVAWILDTKDPNAK